jgi:hypothetical protein
VCFQISQNDSSTWIYQAPYTEDISCFHVGVGFLSDGS